jgi:hypothetical protein
MQDASGSRVSHKMAEDPKTSQDAPQPHTGEIGDLILVNEDGSETVLPPRPDLEGEI